MPDTDIILLCGYYPLNKKTHAHKSFSVMHMVCEGHEKIWTVEICVQL